MVGRALPWTVGLIMVSLVISFVIGNLLGALIMWEHSLGLLKVAIPAMMVFTSIRPTLSGLLLMYIFSSELRCFPLTGAFGLNVEPGWSLDFIGSILYRGFLPAKSIVIVTFGF